MPLEISTSLWEFHKSIVGNTRLLIWYPWKVCQGTAHMHTFIFCVLNRTVCSKFTEDNCGLVCRIIYVERRPKSFMKCYIKHFKNKSIIIESHICRFVQYQQFSETTICVLQFLRLSSISAGNAVLASPVIPMPLRKLQRQISCSPDHKVFGQISPLALNMYTNSNQMRGIAFKL
jgi:hypothetical protein